MRSVMTGRPQRLALSLMLAALPNTATRDRYLREHLAELHDLSARQQLRYLFGVAISLWSLRQSVTDPATFHLEPRTYRSSFVCRLRLGHDWHRDFTEDGQPYQRCYRCGADSSSGARAPRDGLSYAAQRPF